MKGTGILPVIQSMNQALREGTVETGTLVGWATNAGIFIIKEEKSVTNCYCQGCPE